MARIYVQLQVDFADDEKVARLARYGRDARSCRDLLVQMWCYCKREQSDGNVPAELVGKLVYPDSPKAGERDAERLVECDIAERTATGYYLPGFLKHNKSRAQIEEAREAKVKAGQKGGEASGMVRAAQADAKHGASPRRSHSSDNRVQPGNNNDSEQLSGNRNETLRAVAATEPSTEESPEDARCTSHRGVADPGPCRGCRAAREKAQRASDVASERARRDAERRARECRECDGVHVVNDDGEPTRRRCSHGRAAS